MQDQNNAHRSAIEVIGWTSGWRSRTSQNLFSSEALANSSQTINYTVPASHPWVTICFNAIVRNQTDDGHDIFVLCERKGSSLTNNWSLLESKLK